jgi:3'-phosphoadenosine 5'-phosphosulfate sulfotransferase (PAPS reductase)/FAD synthetase
MSVEIPAIAEAVTTAPPSAQRSETPLLLGRLKRTPSGRASLTGHTGDVRSVPDEWYGVIRLMDGFHSIDDIAAESGTDPRLVRKIFDEVRGEKRVGTVEEWNACHWCEPCGVYLSRQRTCAACGAHTRQVPLTPPCDPWVLFEEEHAFVRDLLLEHAGLAIDDRRLLLGNNGVRDNKFFWQIVYAGQVVLHISFAESDPASWKVQVAPDAGALDWSRPTEDLLTEMRRMADANRQTLRNLEADAVAFIDEVTMYYPTDPTLYFSGGKESVVMLRLLEKANRKSNVIFVGTGVDFPEDAQFMLEELKPVLDNHPLFHFEINLAPPEKFLNVFREQKTLDARSAWCRKYIKAPLKGEITKRLYGDDHFVAFEGSRWYENDFRRSHPKVNFADGYDRQIWVHPIAEWTGLDVWSYIFLEGLKINPMYFHGFQRTTCWLCPIVNPFHLDRSRKRYPELWETIRGLELKGFDGGDNLNTPF